MIFLRKLFAFYSFHARASTYKNINTKTFFKTKLNSHLVIYDISLKCDVPPPLIFEYFIIWSSSIFFSRDINKTYHTRYLRRLETWETFTYTIMPGDTDELAWLQNGVYTSKGMFTRALVVSMELLRRKDLAFNLNTNNLYVNLYMPTHSLCVTRINVAREIF